MVFKGVLLVQDNAPGHKSTINVNKLDGTPSLSVRHGSLELKTILEVVNVPGGN